MDPDEAEKTRLEIERERLELDKSKARIWRNKWQTTQLLSFMQAKWLQ